MTVPPEPAAVAGLRHDGKTLRHAQTALVYAMGILAAYWMIERTLPVLGVEV